MGQYTSYYLYQKYEKRGEQDWIPCYPNTYSISGDATNPMSLVVKNENDTQCGYTPTPTEPIYRWVNLDPSTDYYCDGVAKYYKQQRQVSYDGGTTWSNLDEYQRGSQYEASSSDCGGGTTMYRWVNLDPSTDYYCVDAGFIEGVTKVCMTYTDGSVRSIDCDGHSYLLKIETMPDTMISANRINTVQIGNCVTRIDDGAFFSCKSLTSIDIPNSVTSIGQFAFYSCSGLTSVVIPSGVTRIGKQAFRYCRNLILDLPSALISIGFGAFESCRNLSAVTIPSGVTEIGDYAFVSCSGLTSITVLATTPPTLKYTNSGGGWFGNTNNCPIFVPAASVEIYKSAQYWSIYADRIQAIT